METETAVTFEEQNESLLGKGSKKQVKLGNYGVSKTAHRASIHMKKSVAAAVATVNPYFTLNWVYVDPEALGSSPVVPRSMVSRYLGGDQRGMFLSSVGQASLSACHAREAMV